jgi:hypothetical protein
VRPGASLDLSPCGPVAGSGPYPVAPLRFSSAESCPSSPWVFYASDTWVTLVTEGRQRGTPLTDHREHDGGVQTLTLVLRSRAFSS